LSVPVASLAGVSAPEISAPEIADDREAGLLAAARSGDGEAFRTLVDPHLRALHLHCYRMLGSLDDAEEALQEGLLRAWRALDTYRGQAPLRHWLYRITTNASLKVIEKRSRQPVPAGEVSHLQPYPDRLLDQLPDADTDPAAVAERRESVALAFITALQRLPASQRAVLILREVLAYRADEVAALLEMTVPAVNSALQRARATLAASAPGPAGERVAPLSEAEQRTLARFVDAWQRRDIPALAATLRDDVALTMPPDLVAILGRDQVLRFLTTVPAEGRLDLIRLLPTRANGQPALAAYLPDDTGRPRQYGLMVLTVANDGIAEITAFPDARRLDAFGLPAALD
jgi:RNA polymerase sigma-70 factor, ECF subfamily